MADEVRALVEAICRAVCKVEGVDPDDDVFGDSCDAQWTRYADAVAEALDLSAAVATARLRGLMIEHMATIMPAIRNLASNQDQCDMDGVMVKVSRQALCEVLQGLDSFNTIAAPQST